MWSSSLEVLSPTDQSSEANSSALAGAHPLFEVRYMSELVILGVMHTNQAVIQSTMDLNNPIWALPWLSEFLTPLWSNMWNVQPDLLAKLEWLASLITIVVQAIPLLGGTLMVLGRTEC